MDHLARSSLYYNAVAIIVARQATQVLILSWYQTSVRWLFDLFSPDGDELSRGLFRRYFLRDFVI